MKKIDASCDDMETSMKKDIWVLIAVCAAADQYYTIYYFIDNYIIDFKLY